MRAVVVAAAMRVTDLTVLFVGPPPPDRPALRLERGEVSGGEVQAFGPSPERPTPGHELVMAWRADDAQAELRARLADASYQLTFIGDDTRLTITDGST
jgi:hypothetical protein